MCNRINRIDIQNEPLSSTSDENKRAEVVASWSKQLRPWGGLSLGTLSFPCRKQNPENFNSLLECGEHSRLSRDTCLRVFNMVTTWKSMNGDQQRSTGMHKMIKSHSPAQETTVWIRMITHRVTGYYQNPISWEDCHMSEKQETEWQLLCRLLSGEEVWRAGCTLRVWNVDSSLNRSHDQSHSIIPAQNCPRESSPWIRLRAVHDSSRVYIKEDGRTDELVTAQMRFSFLDLIVKLTVCVNDRWRRARRRMQPPAEQ